MLFSPEHTTTEAIPSSNDLEHILKDHFLLHIETYSACLQMADGKHSTTSQKPTKAYLQLKHI